MPSFVELSDDAVYGEVTIDDWPVGGKLADGIATVFMIVFASVAAALLLLALSDFCFDLGLIHNDVDDAGRFKLSAARVCKY